MPTPQDLTAEPEKHIKKNIILSDEWRNSRELNRCSGMPLILGS
jgi:hypothetical protein